MILLRYDTRHVRAFTAEEGFIKPSAFADELLPLASCLFASSSSLALNGETLHRLRQLAGFLQGAPLAWKPPAVDEHWRRLFLEDRALHTAALRFNMEHPGRRHMGEFLKGAPQSILWLRGEADFIPWECWEGGFYAHQGEGKASAGKFRSLHLLFEKALPFAEGEAKRIGALAQKRGFILNGERPDLLFIAGHGRQGRLENAVLEEKTLAYTPKLCAINACSMEARPACACILSPYDTEADRSLFAPLLRFLSGASPREIFIAFTCACIFYPNLGRYYRLYLPEAWA